MHVTTATLSTSSKFSRGVITRVGNPRTATNRISPVAVVGCTLMDYFDLGRSEFDVQDVRHDSANLGSSEFEVQDVRRESVNLGWLEIEVDAVRHDSANLGSSEFEVQDARRESVNLGWFEIEVDAVRLDSGVVLRPSKPLVLSAHLSESGECYRAEVPELDITLAAFDKKDIQDAFCDLLATLWEEYALEDDDNLTAKARRLKACLLRDYVAIE